VRAISVVERLTAGTRHQRSREKVAARGVDANHAGVVSTKRRPGHRYDDSMTFALTLALIGAVRCAQAFCLVATAHARDLRATTAIRKNDGARFARCN
jgi:hypothetical protein